MPKENVNHEEEDTSKPQNGTGTEDTDLDDLFKEEEAPEDETLEEKVYRLEKEREIQKREVAKFFSEKGRREKAAKEAEEQKKTPNHTSDDVTELFLESKPEASFVQDDLKTIADSKYNGSIVKAWKGEAWLQEKAKALSETESAKGKIQPPSTQHATVVSMEAVSRMSDEDQANAIRKMSDKEYSKWQEYLRNHSNKSGVLSL